MKRSLLLFAFFITIHPAFSGDSLKTSRINYISLHKEDAVRDMQKSGVPASITLAQGCLESKDGLSPLATDANNHFGIKCSDWNGPTYTQDDDKKDECFRKYNSVLESYDDHSNFLRTRPRYAALFNLDKKDYKGWAKGLKKAGYATDPSYADRLIRIIEDYQLYLLDENENLPVAVASTDNSVPMERSKKVETKIFVPSSETVDLSPVRKIQENNGVQYIIVKRGDTFKSLAKDLKLGSWQLPRYNEMKDDVPLMEGQIIYIQPKKKESNQTVYFAKEGDTVFSISQQAGIKSKFICRYNKLKDSAEIQPGQKVFLKKL